MKKNATGRIRPAKSLLTLALLVLTLTFGQAVMAQTYKYKTYPNDPLQVREYTLDNGLKVFLSVYKDAPRIQTYIAVRAGSKNDPSETTGLAHYLEHMLFKGSHQLGTTDWDREQVELKKIEDLYEVYRKTTNDAARAAIYHQIDSISYVASTLAIANEYDKSMTAIGSTGTNAFTSNDYTMYVENIPANMVEQWAKVQGDRFPNLVLRLFHTELEAVYEEKNIGMAQDNRRVNETMMAALFPHHPYGTQTTIGTIEHLKNPSMKNIREYHAAYYVPNNMCVAMAGDFNPDEVIKIIDKYMGSWKPGTVPTFTKVKEEPITSPIIRLVNGQDPASLTIAFRIEEGNGSRDALLADAMEMVLNNGSCGLIDLNLNQKQLCLGAYAGTYTLNDYAAFMLGGRPTQGQTLGQLRDLLLEQLELVKKGEFDESLIEASINQLKLRIMKQAESNNSRASQMAYAFVQHQNWGDVVNEINELAKITKQDIVDFANRICKDNNYVIVYKQQDTPDPVTKVQKPAITPIYVSRDNESPFLASIKADAAKAKPIQPQFVNFKKDLQKGKTANGSEVLYVKNVENGTFNLQYRFEFGSTADKTIDMAADLVDYLNTNRHTAEELQEEFYRLACSWGISVGGRTVTVSISGLAENMEKAMTLVEEIMAGAQPNDEALSALVERAIKSRTDGKTNQRAAFRALNTYGIYGEQYIKETTESDEALRAYTARQLTDALHNLFSYKHRVLYYGPLSLKEATAVVNRIHTVKPTKDVPANKVYQPQAVNDNQVLFVNYDAKNTYVTEYFRGEHFNTAQVPSMNLFNEYFGGSMNAIVFQEMREKRSLAYSASSHYTYGSNKDGYFYNSANVITQNDKLLDALNAYEELFDDMPQAEANFRLAKDALLAGSRTARTTKFGIISTYLTCEQMGWKEPLRKQNFQAYQKLTMQDLVRFQQQHIKGQKKAYLILGKESDIDFNAIGKFGKVTKLSLTDIFGF
ncbi:MAG: insulinase family protein [Bacteroidales bacterium]|nr:insulinase family protein [Bacteroidales bacterium]